MIMLYRLLLFSSYINELVLCLVNDFKVVVLISLIKTSCWIVKQQSHLLLLMEAQTFFKKLNKKIKYAAKHVILYFFLLVLLVVFSIFCLIWHLKFKISFRIHYTAKKRKRELLLFSVNVELIMIIHMTLDLL